MSTRTVVSTGTAGVLTLVLALAAQVPPAARQAAPPAVTFAKDVAPILQDKCQVCHQPGSIGPMSLVTYDDARVFASRIKAKVSARLMPPWHIDRTVGIQEFKNDPSLSDAEVETIVQWVDTGTPMGNPADLPPPAEFPDPVTWLRADSGGEPGLGV
jgi:hypothetical protein